MAVNGWMIFFGLLWAYIVFLFWLVRSGRMQKWNLSLMLGIVLMIRTQRGKGLIDKIAKPKRLWNVFGDFGTVLTLVGMVLMTLVMLFTITVVLDRDAGVEPLRASEILVIPGINPFVPLWYGIAALIITLVVHEGGHGILARANNLRVKSLGLLFAIVPIGAFVEPDEDEMHEAPRRQRLRVFAAGATINIVLAGALMFAFAGMVAQAEPVEGVPILGITEDSGAQAAGLRTGDVMVSIDGTPTPDNDAFSDAMDNKSVGQEVELALRDGRTLHATLGDRWNGALDENGQELILSLPSRNGTHTPQQEAAREHCDRLLGQGDYTPAGDDGGACADGLAMLSFLGISHFPIEQLQAELAAPFGNSGINFLRYISLPIGEVRGQPVLSVYLPTFFEEPFDGFWILATLVFWVFWVNLMVGLTNILPMLPLDGGHIFRDAVGGVFARVRPRMEPERRERAVGRLAGIMSFVILGAFLLTIFGPRLVQA